MQAELSERLEDLLSEWGELHAADPTASPFTSPGWAEAWMQHWARGARPWLIAVREGGRLAGLAPLALRRIGPVRVLSGIGRHPGDYWDVVARPAARVRAMEAVAQALAEHAAGWDVLVASGLPPHSRLAGALVDAGHRVVRRAPSACPAIDLPSDFASFEATLPKSHRSNLRRHLRRLDEGQVTLRTPSGRSELVDAIARWRDLRDRQWQAAGRQLARMHRDPRFERFVRDVVLILAPHGLAQVREFWVDGRVAGVYVDFVDTGTFYWFLGGFDPEFAALGLGKIAAGEAIRSSIDAGRRVFDFAHGVEPYKYWFGAHDRLSPSLLAAGPPARAGAALRAAAVIARFRDRSTSAA
jgi:CelD/BcsL family acetyltransferase involved in cellulose biosynthesis